MILWEMTSTLQVPKDLVRPICQHRNVLATNPAIKKVGFTRTIGWPSNKEAPEFISSRRLHLVGLFAQNVLSPEAPNRFLTTCVCGLIDTLGTADDSLT